MHASLAIRAFNCSPNRFLTCAAKPPQMSATSCSRVKSYYLRNPEPIDAYLRRRAGEAEAIRAKIEASQAPRPGLRAVLMERARAKGLMDAQAD
jgi:hypothetical protein